MPDFLWAAAAAPLGFVALLEAPALCLGVVLLGLAGLRLERYRPALLGAALGAGTAFSLTWPVSWGILIGLTLGAMAAPSRIPFPKKFQAVTIAAGLSVGVALLALGPFVPMEWICGVLGSAGLAAVLFRTRWFVVSGASLIAFAGLSAMDFEKPGAFLFYNQIHPNLLGLFNKIPASSSDLGIEAFRGPGGRIYIGTPGFWISDGGRYVENPAMAPIGFALRWQTLHDDNSGLYFAGVVTPELCGRFPASTTHYLRSEFAVLSGDCPLESPLNVSSRRHVMIFDPLDTELLAVDPAAFPDGVWSRWQCALSTNSSDQNFFTPLSANEGPQAYQLAFRTATCTVRVGQGMALPTALERDALLSRYMALEGGS